MPLASAEGHSSCRKAEKSAASEATGSGSAANAEAGIASASARLNAFKQNICPTPTS